MLMESPAAFGNSYGALEAEFRNLAGLFSIAKSKLASGIVLEF
jgi:hypothetical protein